MRKYKRFDFGDFKITKREILASVSIIAMLLLIGVLISSKISGWQDERNEIYNKAVKIESSDLFQYGMNTNIGNAFVYGDLKPIDTVTYPEIGGKYMYVEKVKEKYTMHTRRVSHGSGKNKYYTTETYWSWDYAGEEKKKCKEISFCGINFKSKKILLPSPKYIDTIKESSHVRYKYYGTGTKFTGTIFTTLKDKTISDKSEFYDGTNISETVDSLESMNWVIIFWIGWIIFISVVVFGFFYLDNNWLE